MMKPTVISLYTGAGGLDYGFEAAGFRTAVALDFDKDACETIRRNRSWPVIEGDINEISSENILSTAELKRGEADILIGGPPCQPFSKSGYWVRGDARRLDDPRASTLAAFMRVLEDALPRAFLLENVEGLSYTNKGEGLELLLRWIEIINKHTGSRYAPSFRVLRAADYGVPQVRERFFMIAARDGIPFSFPPPTHGPAEQDGGQITLGIQEPHRTAWDALADVGPDPDEDLMPQGKWSTLLPSIPEGQNYLWHTERGGGLPLFGWRRRFWSFLLKLGKNRPSWTIQAQPGPATGPFHWDNRRLGMREMCRLQTFPDDVLIYGNRGAIQRQVGNAVPSLVAEVLARAVRVQVLGLKNFSGRAELLPPDRSPAPAPAPVAEVPEAFRRLTGKYSAHPGTGKGYRAQNWVQEDAR